MTNTNVYVAQSQSHSHTDTSTRPACPRDFHTCTVQWTNENVHTHIHVLVCAHDCCNRSMHGFGKLGWLHNSFLCCR